MAHFAEIDENNIVLRVLVVDDLHEHRGAEFLAQDCNLGGTWIKTSYNGNIRSNFAGVGFTYDSVLDAFIAPKPYDSWVLNKDARWEAPVEYPTTDGKYDWNEASLSWVQIPTE
jgi:hypothetical protein